MYTLTRHEMQHLQATQPFMPQFPDAEVLSIVFRTDPAFIADVVPRPLRPAARKIAFHSSAQDPLGDIPVRDIVAVTHGRWTNTMLPAKVVGRTFNLPAYLRHTAVRADGMAYLLEHASPRDRSGRRRTWKQIRQY